MAFKALTNTAKDIKKEVGVPQIGTYIGKSDIETKIGKQVVYNFIDDDGLPFSIYGFTNLNRAMQAVKQDSLCRITYKGTQFIKTKFKPAGQDVHQVLVEVDDGSEAAPKEGIPF